MTGYGNRVLLVLAVALIVAPLILLLLDKVGLPRNVDAAAQSDVPPVAFAVAADGKRKAGDATASDFTVSVFVLSTSEEAELFVTPLAGAITQGRLTVVVPDSATLDSARPGTCRVREDTSPTVFLRNQFPLSVDPEYNSEKLVPAKTFVVDELGDCDFSENASAIRWRQPVERVRSSLASEAVLIVANSHVSLSGSTLCCVTDLNLKVVFRGPSDVQMQESYPSPTSNEYRNEGEWTVREREAKQVVARASDRRAALLVEFLAPVLFLGSGIILGSVDWSKLRRP